MKGFAPPLTTRWRYVNVPWKSTLTMKWFAQFGTKADFFFFKPYVHLPGSVCSAASVKSRPDTCVLCRAEPTATSGMPQCLCQNKQALSRLAASSSAGQVESRCRCQSPPPSSLSLALALQHIPPLVTLLAAGKGQRDWGISDALFSPMPVSWLAVQRWASFSPLKIVLCLSIPKQILSQVSAAR